MIFNMNLYPETISQLEALGAVNTWKSHPLCTQKMRLIDWLIRNNKIDIRN